MWVGHGRGAAVCGFTEQAAQWDKKGTLSVGTEHRGRDFFGEGCCPTLSPRARGICHLRPQASRGKLQGCGDFWSLFLFLAVGRRRSLETDPHPSKLDRIRYRSSSPEKGQRRLSACLLGGQPGEDRLVGPSLYPGGHRDKCMSCEPDKQRESEGRSNEAVLQALAECQGLGPGASAWVRGLHEGGDHERTNLLSHWPGLARVSPWNICQAWNMNHPAPPPHPP